MKKTLFLVTIILFVMSCNSEQQGNEASNDFIEAVWNTDKREILKELNNGANPNAVDEEGYPLFCSLIDDCNEEGVALFLEKGANPNCDCDEEPPIELAVDCDNFNLVKLLVDNKADVNARGMLEAPVLSWAIFTSDIETVKYLLDNGASKDATDEDGYYPITYAATVERIKELEALGFSIDVKADNDITFLMDAVESNYPEIVEYLIVEKKVDTAAKTTDGKTVWNFVDEEKQPEMKALLEKLLK